MEPQSIVERLWPGCQASVEPLRGGITNHNFKVAVQGEAFVLRIGGRDTEVLGIDRNDEHDAALAAARAGVAPEVVRFVEPEGYLVTRFLAGARVPLPEMRTAANLEQVAALLRKVHAGDPISGRFDCFRVVEAYREEASARSVELPPEDTEARAIAARIEELRAGAPVCPCHNDLLNANFIRAEGRLWLVDWEYAGMGDPFFDLANFSVNHELRPPEESLLLRAYLGEERQDDRAALTLMRFMSDFREAMWGLVQQGISTLEFDFRAYAKQHFERLRETAAEPRFRAALRRETY
ncbi:MAG TPA: phosphotransferase [Gaiellaceae bacterium]